MHHGYIYYISYPLLSQLPHNVPFLDRRKDVKQHRGRKKFKIFSIYRERKETHQNSFFSRKNWFRHQSEKFTVRPSVRPSVCLSVHPPICLSLSSKFGSRFIWRQWPRKDCMVIDVCRVLGLVIKILVSTPKWRDRSSGKVKYTKGKS